MQLILTNVPLCVCFLLISLIDLFSIVRYGALVLLCADVVHIRKNVYNDERSHCA